MGKITGIFIKVVQAGTGCLKNHQLLLKSLVTIQLLNGNLTCLNIKNRVIKFLYAYRFIDFQGVIKSNVRCM
jgi:hypothetical protein